MFKHLGIGLPTPVFLYRNLNLGRGPGAHVYSIRVGGQVVGHIRHGVMRDTCFAVSLPGRSRAINTGQRNVHAGLRGRLVSVDPPQLPSDVVQVMYTVKSEIQTFFRLEDKQPVSFSPVVYITPDGIFICCPCS